MKLSEPQSVTYRSLFAQIEDGTLKIPQLQRDFTWPLDTSAKLLDSVMKGYPIITPEEMNYLQTTAQALYQDILSRCTAGRKGFVQIHGEDAVRVSSPKPRKKKLPTLVT